MSKGMDVLKLVVAVLVSQLAGIIGGIFTASSVRTWYVALRKPAFTAPSWLFAPVWITLYALMGIAAWLVWRRAAESRHARAALILFLAQLVLNAAWSALFFGLRSPGYAFAEIIVLWAAILLTAIWFARVSAAAGVLFVPYILWVSFAAVLNLSIWRLNP